MKSSLILLLSFLCFSCGRAYVIERTSAIPMADYGRSFAIVTGQNSTQTEQQLEKLVRKHLLKAKWRYDNHQPDYLVTVSSKNEEIHINLLNAKSFRCDWKARVSSLKSEAVIDRALWATLW